MKKTEYRSVQLELNDDKKLRGYAAVFNTLSEDLGGFREQIMPGAFKRNLDSNKDILALGYHDERVILGRSSAGTLELVEDERGLYIEITPPNTTEGRDILEHVKLGNLRHMSFGFYVVDDKIEKRNGEVIRSVNDVELIEVSIVPVPAYVDTEIALRHLPKEVEAPKITKKTEFRRRLFDAENFGSIETDNNTK